MEPPPVHATPKLPFSRGPNDSQPIECLINTWGLPGELHMCRLQSWVSRYTCVIVHASFFCCSSIADRLLQGTKTEEGDFKMGLTTLSSLPDPFQVLACYIRSFY